MQNFIRSEPMIVTSDFPLPTRTILRFGSSATGPQLPIFWCRIKMELLLTLVLDSTPLLVEFWYVLSSIFKSWCNINKKTKVNFLILNPPNRHIKHCLEASFFFHFSEYEDKHSYIGAALGRITERMKGSRFTIDGVEYNVSQNEGQNQVHGGFYGFDSVSCFFCISDWCFSMPNLNRP